jgi:hypothetical protein
MYNNDNNTISGTSYNTISGTVNNTISGTINNTISGTTYNTISGTINNTISGTSYNTISGTINNTISGTSYNTNSTTENNSTIKNTTKYVKHNNNCNNIHFYYNEISILIKNNNMIELKSFDINKIINNGCKFHLEILISNLLKEITIYVDNKINNYKFQYYILLFDFIYLIINEVEKQKNIIIDYPLELLEKTSYLIKGVKYLNKIKNKFMAKNTITDYCEILKKTSMYGTLPTFLFWLDIVKPLNLNNILISSIINSDERIYKYILSCKFINTISFFNNDDYVNYLLVNLLTCNNIPRKYKLKRLKHLYNYVDLKKYYNYMIEIISNLISCDIAYDLTKYYYDTELDFNIIKKLISVYESANYEIILNCESLYNLLKTTNEKNIFAILYNLKGIYNIMNKINTVSSYYNILDKNYLEIIALIAQINYTYNSTLKQQIINYYYNNKYFNKYLDNSTFCYSQVNLYIYTRFYIPQMSHPNFTFIIKLNKCLHYIRMFIKKKNKNKINNFKINFNPIINELVNFEPNNKIKVLHNGSINYNKIKQSYNNIPPRHLLPNEIHIYNNFLIKEKADGILISNLPLNIYPLNEDFDKYEIKAEYIEDLDLYLIFDINIPNLSIEERYIALRNMHPFTKKYSNIQIINNINELNECIIKESNILSEFLNQNTDIKWYPKASWKVDNINDQFISEINNIVNETTEITKGLYNCDGLIITPLNGLREIKIKPKSLMTIDLYYDGINWKDRDNNIWNEIIIEKDQTKISNKIYRCYPVNTLPLKYEYREIRYDKKKPNTYNIVDFIICSYLSNWNNNSNKLYYKNCNSNKIDNTLIKILNNQKEYFIQVLNLIKPIHNQIWLDLGCGKCKFFEIIKLIFKPKKYIGIDIDTHYLAKALKYQDENSHLIQLFSANLKENWNNYEIKWGTFNYSIKVNYVFANFSLMHFNIDNFWEQLDKIVIKGTIFIFNLVKENVSWKYNNSFLYTKDDKVYYNFEWVHNETLIENIICNNDILKYLIKYKWKILSINENNNNDFSKLYNWYIIEKI